MCGDRGGNSDWKDFMRSGRWGGVVGEGGGKEARTSWYIYCELMFIIYTARTYQGRTEIFHANAASALGRTHEVFHQAIPLNAETERRAVRQLHDAQRGCEGGQGEGEEMGNRKRRAHGQKIF